MNQLSRPAPSSHSIDRRTPGLTRRDCPLFLAAAIVLTMSSCAGRVAAQPTTALAEGAEVLHTVLAVYPSAELFPVSDPYLFYWDFGAPPDFNGAVADAQGAGNSAQQAEAVKQHRLSVFWTFGPQWPYGHSKQDFIDFYLGAISSGQASLVDEWQSPSPGAPRGSPLNARNPYGIEGAIAGLEQAKKRSPSSLIFIAWRGESSVLPLLRNGGADYLLIEAYTNVASPTPLSYGISVLGVDLRIAKARSWGVLDRTIPWLGHFAPFDKYHPGHALTVEELGRQIRHYREIAPQMPGLAFYGGASNLVLAKAASDFARKYFIEPAPIVTIASPSKGAVLSRAPHTIRIDATAKGGRKITEYKGYIDNALVYVGSRPSFRWDFREEPPGKHIITVHAVDSGWNRSAVQIVVDCK